MKFFRLALFALQLRSGGLDQLAVIARAAIGDGRLVGIQFDYRIINSVAGKSREDVFDGVDAGIAFGETSRLCTVISPL